MNETHYGPLLTFKCIAEDTDHDVRKSDYEQFNLLHNTQEVIRFSTIFGQGQIFQGKCKLAH